RALRNWLGRKSRINARAAEKQKFAHTILMRGGDDVVLNPQIIEQKLHRLIVVCFDTADFGSRENHDLRFFFGKKLVHGRYVSQIELAPVALKQVLKAGRLERSDKRAADHSPVASDKDFIGLLYRHQRISIIFSAGL